MASDTTPSGADWIAAFARQLGLAAPDPAAVATLLEVAAEAAHASERTAAPVACWLAARAGRTPSEAVGLASGVGG